MTDRNRPDRAHARGQTAYGSSTQDKGPNRGTKALHPGLSR
jgi:hypothetical protein